MGERKEKKKETKKARRHIALPTLPPTFLLTLLLISALILPASCSATPFPPSPIASLSENGNENGNSDVTPVSPTITLTYPYGKAIWLGSASFDPNTVISPTTLFTYTMNGTHLLVNGFPFPQSNITCTLSASSIVFSGNVSTLVLETGEDEALILSSSNSSINVYTLRGVSLNEKTFPKSHELDDALILVPIFAETDGNTVISSTFEVSVMVIFRFNASQSMYSSASVFNISTGELLAEVPYENNDAVIYEQSRETLNGTATIQLSFKASHANATEITATLQSESFSSLITLPVKYYTSPLPILASIIYGKEIKLTHFQLSIFPFLVLSLPSLFTKIDESMFFWNGRWHMAFPGFFLGLADNFFLRIKVADSLLLNRSSGTIIPVNPRIPIQASPSGDFLTVSFLIQTVNLSFTIPLPTIQAPPPQFMIPPINHYLHGIPIHSEREANYTIKTITGETVKTGTLTAGVTTIYLPDGWYILEVEGVEKGFIVTGMLSDTLRSNLPAFAQWSINTNAKYIIVASVAILALTIATRKPKLLLLIPLTITLTPIIHFFTLQPLLAIL